MSATETQRARALAFTLYLALFWVLILLPFDFGLPRSLRSVLSAEVFQLESRPGTLAIEMLKSASHAVLLFPFLPLLAWAARTRFAGSRRPPCSSPESSWVSRRKSSS